MKNLQAPEKRVLTDGQVLDVHSIFYTIQGEGPFSGTPAVFIRLAGCNLQCPLCDTEYTVGRQQLSIAAIFNKVMFVSEKNVRQLVVITGGEPFRQNIAPLVALLHTTFEKVQIETNGTLAVPDGLNFNEIHDNYLIVSPKASKVHQSVIDRAYAYKYVLSHGQIDPDDGLPLQVLGHPCYVRVARPPDNIPVYIQPADHQHDPSNQCNITACIRSCIKFGYILQLQVHKLIKVP